MPLSSHAHNLLQAFAQPGCPVCRLTDASVRGYLDSLMYEYFNEPPTHIAVRAARGFCPAHAWQIQEQITASALGVALLYEGVIRTLLQEMGALSEQASRTQINKAAAALKPQGPCPACTHRDTVEDHLLRSLLEHLEQPAFAEGWARSAGLCLPHLRLALERSGHLAAKARLVATQQVIWERLQHELAEYIRKSDYQYAGEPIGEEGSSPRRAILQMAGEKGLR